MRKLIIYDESCPMCKLYTKGMVAADRSACLSRMGNSQLTNETLISCIDPQRARHEIPLIDLDGGETLYGVDTWIYAFGHHNHSLEKLLSLRWFKTILQKFYAFISYNRRIIITSAPGRWQLLDLQPEFRLTYRLAFILLIFGAVGLLFSNLNGTIWPIATLVFSQLAVIWIYLKTTPTGDFRETLLDYTGHLGMSLLVGGVCISIGQTASWSDVILIGYALMIGQHFIRTYRLGLNPWLSVGFTILVFLLLLPQ